MTLYEVSEDGVASPSERVEVRSEGEELTDLLARNPWLLPGDQIDPEVPRRWLVIRKEMPVPDPGGGGGRWSVDVLLTDQSGIPTFVECKRFRDTRARREVVGQILEYAANGHFYWEAHELREYLASTAMQAGRSLDQLLLELDPEDAGTVDELLERFVENLREGQVRLVFFMEEAPRELKSIVDFLNRQTERTEVLIVEARMFQVDGRRFVVPSLFGYTEEARRAKRTVNVSSGGGRRRWNEEQFFEDAAEKLAERDVQALRKILDKAYELEFRIKWGTGVQRGSFSLVAPEFCPRSVTTFYSDGTLSVNRGWLNGSPVADAYRVFAERVIRSEVGLPAKEPDTDYWTYAPDQWIRNSDEFVGAMGFLRRGPEELLLNGISGEG